MNSLKFVIFVPGTLLLISMLASTTTIWQSSVYAQPIGEGTGNITTVSNSTTIPMKNIENATSGVEKMDLSKLKTILATPFTSITAISLIPGLQVSGVNFGDTQISVTVKQIQSPGNTTNMTTPITVTAVRIPVSDLEDLLSLVKDSGLLGDKAGINIPGMINDNPLNNLLGGSSGLIGGDQNSKDPISSVRPFQLLKDIQFGTGSIVGGDWTYPRTVTMGFLDIRSFFGIQENIREPASAHLITIFVVPYVGVTNLGSVPLH
ncbi:MAG TPA: hypothetical protein VLA74_14235 [Nitrososphaeraceae archaeon]|nr:hypothetical protein [Nitrososphaeraceae archaeon]